MRTIFKDATAFAMKSILPYAKEMDEKAMFPAAAFKEIGKAGYFKLMVPKAFGGDGGTLQDHTDVVRAFAKSSATAGLCYMMHNVALMCVLTYGDEALKAKICKDIVDNEVFMALAYSELGTGTHFYQPEITAQFNGNKVTFTGKKSMVTSAGHAAYYLVLAPSDTQGAIDNWVFPFPIAGLTFDTGTWNGLGMRGNVSCVMDIENLTLDTSWRIGGSGTGQEQVFSVVAPFFITGLSAVYTGVCEAILEESRTHAINRKYPTAKALCTIETVQIHLAKIYTMTNAAILATDEAARAGTAGESDALAKILSARILASEAAIELARLGMRIGGGKAYNKQGIMERLLRDSYAGQIMAPSVDVLTVWLGKAITDQPIP
jgi:hypothetical protein